MRYRVTVYLDGAPDVDLVLRDHELRILRNKLQDPDTPSSEFWMSSYEAGSIVEMFRLSAVIGVRTMKDWDI